jgi:hypothetical protein
MLWPDVYCVEKPMKYLKTTKIIKNWWNRIKTFPLFVTFAATGYATNRMKCGRKRNPCREEPDGNN